MAEEDGTSWRLLFQKGTLFAVVVGAVIAALQHAVGIESIIYHSPIIFEKAGISTKRMAMVRLMRPHTHALSTALEPRIP